jgi:hypothetical protein
MITSFKFCARAILNLLEKIHPPGSQNLSSRIFFHYSTLQVPKEAIYIKNRIQIAVLRNWEQFQICSVFFIHPVVSNEKIESETRGCISFCFVISDSTKRAFSLGSLVLSKQTFIYMSRHRTCSQVVFEKAKLQLQTNNISWTRTI